MSSFTLHWNYETYQQLWYDYRFYLKPEERPVIIFYADGFTPALSEKHNYEGILWATSPHELKEVLTLTNNIAVLRDKPIALRPEGLAPQQQEQYDASTDLREWEHITADTYQSLKHILTRVQRRKELSKKQLLKRYSSLFTTGDEDFTDYEKSLTLDSFREIHTILDCGTGEGRIGGQLARLGFNVVGLDISPAMLQRSRQRIVEEGQALRGETDDAKLSAKAIKQLQREGIASKTLLDDEQTAEHYITVHGDFFKIDYELNVLMRDWNERYPAINQHDFMNVDDEQRPYAFENPYDKFSDAGFDMALFNWNTFCEIGDPANQKEVLRQIANVMWPGGELVIEVPDRGEEPYASAIQAYHQQHPDMPYGTHADTYTADDGTTKEYSPRYFPGKEELVTLLRSVGFEIDPENDIQRYDVDSTDPETGEKKREAKELFITARKAKR